MVGRGGKTLYAALVVFCLATMVQAQETLPNVPTELVRYPDIIVHNAKIVTVNDASLSNSTGRVVEALAIQGDRIQFIGSNTEVMRYAGPQTRKIDLKGRTVIPGLINTHSHMHDHFLQHWVVTHPEEVEKVTRRFSVSGSNFEELSRGIEIVIKEQMARPLPGQWAWIDLPSGGSAGTGIGVQYLIEEQMTRQKLDQLAPNLPVFILSHPKFLLNTAARDAFLSIYEVPPTEENEQLALTQDTTINRSLVVDQYFAEHLDELADVLDDGLQRQVAMGFTTFSSHIVGLRIYDAYMKLVRAGRMPIRFGYADRFCQQVEPDMTGCFIRKGDIAGLGDKYFWNVGVTLGGIDAGPPQICTTMEAPKEFKDQERCVLQPGNAYAKAIYAALRSRLRFVVNHDYGDKTMDYVMDIMEQIVQENPGITMDYIRSLRLTGDHCGFYPRKAQIARMKDLGMMISCAPRMINRSAPWLKVYGDRYADRITPIKSMLDGGLMPTAEGEFRDAIIGEIETVFAQYFPFISRKTDWDRAVAPEEAIDRGSLLKMATVWASYYVLKEKELGTLEPGKFADFLVLNKDYLTVPQEEIPTVFPLMTVVGGKTIVLREELAKEFGVSPVGPQLKFKFATDEEDSDPKRGEYRSGGEE